MNNFSIKSSSLQDLTSLPLLSRAERKKRKKKKKTKTDDDDEANNNNDPSIALPPSLSHGRLSSSSNSLSCIKNAMNQQQQHQQEQQHQINEPWRVQRRRNSLVRSRNKTNSYLTPTPGSATSRRRKLAVSSTPSSASTSPMKTLLHNEEFSLPLNDNACSNTSPRIMSSEHGGSNHHHILHHHEHSSTTTPATISTKLTPRTIPLAGTHTPNLSSSSCDSSVTSSSLASLSSSPKTAAATTTTTSFLLSKKRTIQLSHGDKQRLRSPGVLTRRSPISNIKPQNTINNKNKTKILPCGIPSLEPLSQQSKSTSMNTSSASVSSSSSSSSSTSLSPSSSPNRKKTTKKSVKAKKKAAAAANKKSSSSSSSSSISIKLPPFLERIIILAAIILVLEMVQKSYFLNDILLDIDHTTTTTTITTPTILQNNNKDNDVHSKTSTVSKTQPSVRTTTTATASLNTNPNAFDVTLLKSKKIDPLSSSLSSSSSTITKECTIPPSRGVEGKMGFQALTKIQIAETTTTTTTTEASSSSLSLLCIVLTDSTRHDTQLQAIVDTYAPYCDGFLAASNATDPSLGAVAIIPSSTDSTTSSSSMEKHSQDWELMLATWKYIHDSNSNNNDYRNSFDIFFMIQDDTYIIPENIKSYISDNFPKTWNAQQQQQQPMYLGGPVVPSRKTPDIAHCGGGAGYILNRMALDIVATDVATKCKPTTTSMAITKTKTNQKVLPADQQMGQCLRDIAQLSCKTTSHPTMGLRQLEFGLDYQARWNKKTGGPIKVKPLADHHGVYMNPTLAGIAPDAFSIHLVNGTEPLQLSDYYVKDPTTTSSTTTTTTNPIRRVHAILRNQCVAQWEQPIQALDEHGIPGYIHDPTFLSKNPLPFTMHPPGDANGVCQPKFGQGIEGEFGIEGLQKIQIKDDILPTDPKYKSVLCIIYTHSGQHEHQVRAIAETYGPRCDGFLAASNLTDPTIGAVNILHEGPEAYTNMWLKVRSIWQYVYDHYSDQFDFFHIGGDDHFVIPENLRHVVATGDIQGLWNASGPLFLGGNMIDFPHTQIRYCGGGSGYTLNRKALKILVEDLFDTHHCRPHFENAQEDRIISNCLRTVDITCMDTNDEFQESRYHQANVDFHSSWNAQIPSVWRADSLEKVHGIVSKEGLGQISKTSISFHLKGKHRGVQDRGMRRYHAILHGLCPDSAV